MLDLVCFAMRKFGVACYVLCSACLWDSDPHASVKSRHGRANLHLHHLPRCASCVLAPSAIHLTPYMAAILRKRMQTQI